MQFNKNLNNTSTTLLSSTHTFRERSTDNRLDNLFTFSRCFVLFICLLFSGMAFSQNTITVKKTEKVKKVSYSGFYYSEFYTLSNGEPGAPPKDLHRMYMYIDSYNSVYIFHSKKAVKKVYEKFMKDPSKYTEETGVVEFSDLAVYLKMQANKSGRIYRYVGEIYDVNSIYLSYKATSSMKRSLNLGLFKYSK